MPCGDCITVRVRGGCGVHCSARSATLRSKTRKSTATTEALASGPRVIQRVYTSPTGPYGGRLRLRDRGLSCVKTATRTQRGLRVWGPASAFVHLIECSQRLRAILREVSTNTCTYALNIGMGKVRCTGSDQTLETRRQPCLAA